MFQGYFPKLCKEQANETVEKSLFPTCDKYGFFIAIAKIYSCVLSVFTFLLNSKRFTLALIISSIVACNYISNPTAPSQWQLQC